MKHNSPNWQKEFYPRSQVLTLAQHPLEGWNRKLFRNVGNEPTHTAQQPRITKISNNFFNSWFLASWINVNKIVQLDATICRHLFTAKSLYMFRASQHPSSGALKTVTATSDIGHNTGTATSFHRGLILIWPVLIRPRWKEVAVPVLWPIPEVAVTVFSAPDNGCCDARNM